MMEQRPVVPYASVSDDYTYGTNPTDWHEAFVTVVKGTLILVVLSLSAYFLYGIITS